MAKPRERLVRSSLALLSLIAPVVFLAAPLRAQTYTFKIIDDSNAQPESAGILFTQATGVNDAGTVVGSYSAPEFTYYGFYGSDSNSLNTIGFLGGCGSFCGTAPWGINNLGEIVGEWDDGQGYTHGFYEKRPYNQAPVILDYPNATLTIAQGVNSSGTIVGGYQDSSGTTHGFKYTGSFSTLDFSVCPDTYLYGVNDRGDVVGYCPTGTTEYDYVGAELTSQGQLIEIAFPGATLTRAYGINNVGQIVGTYSMPNGTGGCFVYAGGNYNPIPNPPNAVGGATCYGINNIGQIVGYYQDAQGAGHGFIASGPVLLDPVPTNTDPIGLLDGPAVGNTDWLQSTPGSGAASYGLNGRVVNGIAADGVSEIVIRIPAKNVGDQFTLTLLNDANAASTSTQNDGALGNPGDTTFTQNQVTVSAISLTAVDGSQSAYAFAVYRAPVDFVRPPSGGATSLTGTQHFFAISTGFSPPCGGPWNPCTATVNFGSLSPGSRTDDQLASRGVAIQIQDLTNGNTFSLPVEILRPPVVLIHGLWSSWHAWDNFTPLVNGSYDVDPRFYIGRVDYSYTVGPYLMATNPQIVPALSGAIKANSLGWAYNSIFVLNSLQSWIESFKGGSNPLGIPAADVEADVIAHSMGGDIARTLVLQPTFLSSQTFGLGSIHKLITIDTPHLGTPIASNLLSPGEIGGCAENALADYGQEFVLNSVMFDDYDVWPGAVADLVPNSFALSQIATQSPRLLPTALIAGTNPNFDSIPPLLYDVCGNIHGDALAQADHDGPTWDASIFQDAPNDGLVPETSELANLPLNSSSAFIFPGVDHSDAIEGFRGLGFAGPGALNNDSDTGIPSTVIRLLNTPITNPAFQLVNP